MDIAELQQSLVDTEMILGSIFETQRAGRIADCVGYQELLQDKLVRAAEALDQLSGAAGDGAAAQPPRASSTSPWH